MPTIPALGGGSQEDFDLFGNVNTQYCQELSESCYNLVSVPVAGANYLCVDCLCLCLLVLVISFCVLGLGLMTFLDIGQTESTLLNILVNHWREVRKRGEGQVSYSLFL